MIKFRVVPVVSAKLYYKIQHKHWYGWRDSYNSGNVFDSPEEARACLYKNYGMSGCVIADYSPGG